MKELSKYYVKDIAKDLGLNKRTVIKYINEGFLPCETELWGSRAIYFIDQVKYLEWKRKHFRGVSKVNISKLNSKLREPGKIEILESWMPEWLDWLKTGKLSGKPISPRMLEIYEYYFRYYLKLLPSRPSLPVISVKNFRLILGEIEVEKYSTRVNIFSSLMSITKYLVETGKFTVEIREELKKLRPRRYLPAKRPCINQEQLEKVVNFIDASKYGSDYDRLLSKTLIFFISKTGLRASEVANLTLKDVDLEAKVIHVLKGKGRKNRRVGITNESNLALEKYLKIRLNEFEDQEFFFLTGAGTSMSASSIHQKIERVSKNFDFHFTPHALRRSFVTINANQGKPLVHLQIACGHADITTTRSYCQTSQDEVVEAMANW